jgi:hypothetical protein
MKMNIKKIGLAVFVCLLAVQTHRALAQTNNYNNVDWSHISAKEMMPILEKENPSQIPTNAWTSILEKLKWPQIPSNVQQYIATNVSLDRFPANFDIEAMAKSMPRPAWPDSPQKQAGLKRSADILRSTVGTNELAFFETHLTNQLQSTNYAVNGGEIITASMGADMVLCFENFSKQMTSDMNEFADLLASPELKTYGDGWGKAEISSPDKNKGVIKYSFWPNGSLISVSRTTSDGEFEIAHAQFNSGGKLFYYGLYCREPEPFWFAKIGFGLNGQLESFSGIINNQLQFVFFPPLTSMRGVWTDLDKLDFRISHLEKPVHQRM